MSANALTAVVSKPFSGLLLLETLLLSRNQINETSADSFVPLTNLKVLSLSDNRLTVSE